MPHKVHKAGRTASDSMHLRDRMPEISATAICHMPSPAGARTGTSHFPIMAPKLSAGLLTIPFVPKFKINHMIMDAIKIVVPALVR